MKTIFAVHGVGFELSDELSERIRFVEHEALEDLKHELVTKEEVIFISLGGVEDDNHEKNAHVAYDLLEKHKTKIPKGATVMTLGGKTMLEECLEVLNFVQDTYKDEKVRIVAGIESAPFRPFRLKASYKVPLLLSPLRNFAIKHPIGYRIIVPFLSLGALLMPSVGQKIEIGHYHYPFLKSSGGRWNELKSLFFLIIDPFNVKNEKEEEKKEEKEEPQKEAEVKKEVKTEKKKVVRKK